MSTRWKPSIKQEITKSKTIRAKTPKTVQPTKSLEPMLKSGLRQAKVNSYAKQVQFLEGPIQPHFYACDESVKQSTLAGEEDGNLIGWTPLGDSNHRRLSSSRHGTTQLFEGSKTHCLITLKQHFLARYASVQWYEERRKQEASARGEHPRLGQLEYGNAKYKVALQAAEAITAQDIGMLQDLSTSGKGVPKGGWASTVGPVLVFGSFKEPFEPAPIPKKMVESYKKPVRWLSN
jgi:hypothetical protein